MKGRIIKIFSSNYQVLCGGKEYVLSARGNLKQNKLVVGDEVEFGNEEKVITLLYPRKNKLIRPKISNIDKMFIVIAPLPEPDLIVVDKMILFCLSLGISPYLVINKTDLANVQFIENIKNEYSNVIPILTTCAKQKGTKELEKEIKGNICAFSGASAVGKSALLNAILPKAKALEGELTAKIERGTNTTRSTQLYSLDENTFLADTAGFTKLDEGLLDVTHFSLASFYPDFLPFLDKCKYKSCTHIKEKEEECAVKMAVKKGIISQGRYERYKQIYNGLENRWKKEHK